MKSVHNACGISVLGIHILKYFLAAPPPLACKTFFVTSNWKQQSCPFQKYSTITNVSLPNIFNINAYKKALIEEFLTILIYDMKASQPDFKQILPYHINTFPSLIEFLIVFILTAELLLRLTTNGALLGV